MSEHEDEHQHEHEPEHGPEQDPRVASRAELLPEERSAGSEEPLEQAEAILAESDARTAEPERTEEESPQTLTSDRRG